MIRTIIIPALIEEEGMFPFSMCFGRTGITRHSGDLELVCSFCHFIAIAGFHKFRMEKIIFNSFITFYTWALLGPNTPCFPQVIPF
jgi:hypothetical protein